MASASSPDVSVIRIWPVWPRTGGASKPNRSKVSGQMFVAPLGGLKANIFVAAEVSRSDVNISGSKVKVRRRDFIGSKQDCGIRRECPERSVIQAQARGTIPGRTVSGS